MIKVQFSTLATGEAFRFHPSHDTVWLKQNATRAVRRLPVTLSEPSSVAVSPDYFVWVDRPAATQKTALGPVHRELTL